MIYRLLSLPICSPIESSLWTVSRLFLPSSEKTSLSLTSGMLRRLCFQDELLRLTDQTETSCRRRGQKWFVAINKWQDITEMEVCQGLISYIIRSCFGI